MADLKFQVNADEIAAAVGKTKEAITIQLRTAIQGLVASTHAFVVQKAQAELSGYKREAYLGENGKNVRWEKIAENIWVVEVDESARWLEEGRGEQFMGDWLLKGNNVKTAKDGSSYRVIPLPQKRGVGGEKTFQKKPILATSLRNLLKQNNINLGKLEKAADGSPKLGILHNIPVNPQFTSTQAPELFSRPRSPMEAQMTGLPAHEGHYLLGGLAVMQREVTTGGKKKVVREAVTFRVISSKHAADRRWMYPEVKALNAIPEAFEWAKSQWSSVILPELENSLRGQT